MDQVAFSLPTPGVIVRPLDLPAVSDDRLDRAVRYEVEDKDSEIPFSPEEVVMDYEVVERTEKETRVVLVVVKRDKIEEYIQVIRNVDLEAKIIDVTSFSLFNTYQYFQDQPDSSSPLPKALVDVGEFHTDIVIFRGTSLHYARSISIAGRTFTESIQDQLNVEFNRAEELKIENGNFPLTEEPSPPSPPDLSGQDSKASSDDNSDSPVPPPPPDEGDDEYETADENDGSLQLGTKFGTDESVGDSFDKNDLEEPAPPPSGEDLDLEGGLDTGTDSVEDDEDSESLTLGGNQEFPDDEPEDEEATLNSNLDLGSSGSKSDPPAPPEDIEPTEEDHSDQETPPTPPEPPQSQSSDKEAEVVDKGDGVTLGSEYKAQDSSDEGSSDEYASSPSDVPSDSSNEMGSLTGETELGGRAEDEEIEQSGGSDQAEMNLDLDLGDERSPGPEVDSDDELIDPLSDSEAEEADDGGKSLGAAANQPPSPPTEPEYDPKKIQEALEEPVQRMIDELRQTFDYFRDEMNGKDVEEIILCGNGARIRNLSAYIEGELARKTRYFEPSGVTGVVDEESVQTMLSILGLQLRSDPSRCSVQLNLLPEELVRERELKERNQKMILNGALSGLLVLQVLVWLFYSYQVRLSYYEQSNKQLEQVQPIVDRVSQLERTQSTLQQRLDVINKLETRRARLLPVLYELNQLDDPLRQRTWIRNISFSAGEPHGILKLEGVTGSFQDVSQFYEWLEEQEFTLDQTSGSQNRSTLTVDGEQQGVVQFSVGYEVQFDPYNTTSRES